MAVQQISRIMNRRGLRIDLPIPLNDAEFGWAEDTRELFIGEGPFFGDNTQIITQYTPANLPIYTYLNELNPDNPVFSPITGNNSLNTPDRVTNFPKAITGADPFGDPFIPNANFPTIRSYQQKFDDVVSVKDYGAIGDGKANDTPAILRAMFDLYNQTTSPFDLLDDTSKFRALYFPAGTYRIEKFVPLYPFCTLLGDGKTKTKILLDTITPAAPITFDTSSVAKSVDSLGQGGSNIGADLGDGFPTILIPKNIVVRGISFESNTVQTEAPGNKDIVRLDKVINATFDDCEFVGTWTGADTFTGGSRAVVLRNRTQGVDGIPQNISFLNCTFRSTAFAFNIVEKTRNIYVSNSTFETHYIVVKLGLNPAIDIPSPVPNSVGIIDLFRVSHCRFAADIVNSAFDVRTVGRGNISTYNVYEGVYGGVAGEAAIVFGGPTVGHELFDPFTLLVNTESSRACVSIGDTFPDMEVPEDCIDKLTNPRVQNAGDADENVVMNAQDLFQIPIGFCGNITIFGDLTVTGDILLGGSIISTTLPAFVPAAIGTVVIESIPYSNGNIIYYEYGMKDSTVTPLTATYRVGTLTIIHNASYDGGGLLIGDPTVVDFTDNFNELNGPFPVGAPVTLTVALGANDVDISVNIGGGISTPVVVGVVRVQKV